MCTAKSRWLSMLAVAAALLFVPVLMAAKNRAEKKNQPAPQTVELFKAIEEGQIAVRLIPKDSKQSNVSIENKTKAPLNVKLPNSFAGVPVLAQRNNGGGGYSSNNTNNNQNQSYGGGMGGMNGGMMGGGGFFNIAPEKVGQFKVTTVCLEHGKNEPRSAIPYEIKPLESVTQKSGVKELCEALGTGQISQRAAQAAAWHLNNDMSWEELASKQLKHANGTAEPYFSAAEIQAGMELANSAKKLAVEKEKQTPSSESRSYESSGNK